MATVTAPIMTDATGQSIDSKLNSLLGKMDNLAAAFQPNASGIVYSNTTSGLTGDDVQEAIDEMAADVSEIKQSLSDLENNLDKYTSANLDNFYFENITFVALNKSINFSNGSGSISLSSDVPSGKRFISICFAVMRDTNSLYVTGSIISNNTLQVKCTSSYSGTQSVHVLAFAVPIVN